MFRSINADWFQQHERTVAAAIVLLALLHGLIYIFVVPPWQHYDEPTHFEYAWLIANTGELPEEDGFDWNMRADLVRSMIEHDFFRGLPVPNPDALDPSRAVAGLQFPQLDDPPLYYLLVSVPVGLLKSSDMAAQLIGGRLVSLLLLGVTVFAGWGIVRTITPRGSVFRYLVPLTMAMLPGFVELMTAVNNDVGAAAVFSLFLWGAVRVIRRGVAPLNLAWVLVATLAAVFTKSTAYLAVPLAMVALVLGILPGDLRRYAWIVVGAGALAVGVGLIYLSEPAYWYRATSQDGPIRVELAAAPLGEHVLVMDPAADVTPRWLRAINQPIPIGDVERLGGEHLTFGFFMWFDADDPAITEIEARSPAINLDLAAGEDTAVFEFLRLAREPLFFRVETDVPADVLRIWVSMTQQSSDLPAGVRLYFDGLVLVEGFFLPGTLPEFADRDAAGGTWSEKPFRNLLRNGSAENTWPALRPWADNVSARILPSNVRLSILMYTLFDRDGASWYYLLTSGNIFQTFWGRFGWGHVPLPGAPSVYWFFGILTAAAVVGVVVYPFGERGKTPVDSLMFLGLALLMIWFAAFARGAIFIFVERVFLPSVRYAFPVIVPTVLVLVSGWYALAFHLKRLARIPNYYFLIIYLDFLLFYDVIALWGIRNFFA